MSDKLIESFLKYEEQRKAQKNPNEFQSVKNLQERNNVRKEINADPVGTGEALRPEIARRKEDAQNAASDRQLIAKAQEVDKRREDEQNAASDRQLIAKAQEVDKRREDEQNAARNTDWASNGIKIVRADRREANREARVDAAREADAYDRREANREARITAAATTQRIADRANRGAEIQDITNGSPATPARPNDGNNGVSAPSERALNTRPGLRAGPASTNTIKALQSHLGITADGIAGPQTRQAVMKFQREHGLQVDGIIGDQTRMAFERSLANRRNEQTPTTTTERPEPAGAARAEDEAGAPPRPELAAAGTRITNLRVGSRGDDVKSAQEALGISDDGIYGNQTRQAVMDFQRKHGLQVDGIIGDQTMSALRRARAGLSVRGSGAATNESVQFSEAELAHFKSILEAMPVAPTAEGHGPNPTPKNKAEGGKGRGSLSEMKKK